MTPARQRSVLVPAAADIALLADVSLALLRTVGLLLDFADSAADTNSTAMLNQSCFAARWPANSVSSLA